MAQWIQWQRRDHRAKRKHARGRISAAHLIEREGPVNGFDGRTVCGLEVPGWDAHVTPADGWTSRCARCWKADG